jgi:hypothetical protein
LPFANPPPPRDHPRLKPIARFNSKHIDCSDGCSETICSTIRRWKLETDHKEYVEWDT